MLQANQGTFYPVQELRNILPFKPLLLFPTQVSPLVFSQGKESPH